MSNLNLRTYLLAVLMILLTNFGFSQSLSQQKMKQLDFLIGEWIGTSVVYKNGKVIKQGAAYESISYDLDQNILVINLNTEFLQLHTIVNYDEKDQRYYYHRFSKDGSAIYPAEFENGQLVVSRDEETRFYFGVTEDGGFVEYGEKWINGEWVRYFEDVFVNTE